jgi:hypothetical protein
MRQTRYGVAVAATLSVGAVIGPVAAADASTVLAKKVVTTSTYSSFPSHAKYAAKPLDSTKLKKVVYKVVRNSAGEDVLKVTVSLKRVFKSTKANSEVVGLQIAPNQGGGPRYIYSYAGSAVVIANSDTASLDAIAGSHAVRDKSADTITLIVPLAYTGLDAAKATITTTVNYYGQRTRANGLETVVQFSESTSTTKVVNFH